MWSCNSATTFPHGEVCWHLEKKAVLLVASLTTFIDDLQSTKSSVSKCLWFKVHWLLGFRSHYFSLLSSKRAVEQLIKIINKSIRQNSLNTIKNTE